MGGHAASKLSSGGVIVFETLKQHLNFLKSDWRFFAISPPQTLIWEQKFKMFKNIEKHGLEGKPPFNISKLKKCLKVPDIRF